MKIYRLIAPAVCGLVALFVPDVSPAAETPVELGLAQYVPAEVGLCVEGRGVSAAVSEFLDGPMYARWKNYPPLAAWHAEQGRQIEKLSQVLKQNLGVGWDDLRSRLFGRSWLLAVFPPDLSGAAPAGPFDGFFLAEVEDAALLRQAADKLCELHRRDGRYVGHRAEKHGDRTFTVHELKSADGSSLFLTVDGNFGCVATRFDRLESVLRLYTAADRGASLGARAEYRDALAKLSPQAVLRAYLRPEVWPLDVIASNKDKQPTEERLAVETWQALDSIAVALELGGSPRLEVHFAWQRDKLPEPIRGLVGAFAGGESPAASIPGDCLFAFSLQADLKRIASEVMNFVEAQATARGERLPAEAVIAGRLIGTLGPNAVGYVVPAKPGDERPLPIDWALGVDTQPMVAGEASPAEVLDPLVRMVMILAADAHNASRPPTAKVETVEIDQLRMTGLTGLGPSADLGVFTARVGGRLWAGGSPQTLARGAKPGSPESLATAASYRRVHNPRLDDARQFAYVNFAAVRRSLDEVVTAPPAWLAPLSSPAAQPQIRELRSLLSLLDAAVLEAAVADNGLRVSLAMTVGNE